MFLADGSQEQFPSETQVELEHTTFWLPGNGPVVDDILNPYLETCSIQDLRHSSLNEAREVMLCWELKSTL